MFILGSCLALELSYSGCCSLFLSPHCSHKGCYCDQYCHKWNDCCSDVANIGCHSASTTPTPTCKTKSIPHTINQCSSENEIKGHKQHMHKK